MKIKHHSTFLFVSSPVLYWNKCYQNGKALYLIVYTSLQSYITQKEKIIKNLIRYVIFFKITDLVMKKKMIIIQFLLVNKLFYLLFCQIWNISSQLLLTKIGKISLLKQFHTLTKALMTQYFKAFFFVYVCESLDTCNILCLECWT